MEFREDAIAWANEWANHPRLFSGIQPVTPRLYANGVASAWVDENGLCCLRYADKDGMPQVIRLTPTEAYILGGRINALIQEVDEHFTSRGIIWR